METGKYYKHGKRSLYVKTIDKDWKGYINILYHDGRFGKLIQNPPGWEEITENEWKKEWDEMEVKEKENDDI